MKLEDISKLDINNYADVQSIEFPDSTDTDAIFMGLSMEGLFIALLLSFIGFVYFRYGKAANDLVSMLVGIALMLCPYFVSKTLYLILCSIGIMLFHFVLKKKS